MPEPILMGVYGAVVGGAYGLIGYFRRTDKGDKFSWKKFAPDVIITAVAGAIIGYTTGTIPAEPAILATVTTLGSLGVTKFIRKIFNF